MPASPDTDTNVPTTGPKPPVTLPAAQVAPGEGHFNRLVLPTWIEIELVDEAGQPVPHAHYRITLPDTRSLEGYLDAKGCARVDNIARGLCEVTFPDLDTDAWTRLQENPPA